MVRGRVTATRTGLGVYGGRSGAVLTRGYFRGAREMAAKLSMIEKTVRDEALAEVARDAEEIVAEEWRIRVRSQIGIGPGVAHYAEAIDVLARPGRQGATAIVGLKNVPLSEGEAQPREYASRFEFGSTTRSLAQFKAGITHAGRTRAAIPTLRPAFDATVGKCFDSIGRGVWALIEKIV